MWTARSKKLSGDRGIQVAVDFCSQPATVGDVLRGWQDDGGFRTLFNSLLAEAPYTAFRWETPPVTAASLSQRFEFVLLDCPSLARRPDPAAFAEHFGQGVEGVAVFPNLGGDAIMVVPCPIADPAAYGHLAVFVRLAPEASDTLSGGRLRLRCLGASE